MAWEAEQVQGKMECRACGGQRCRVACRQAGMMERRQANRRLHPTDSGKSWEASE